MRSWTTPREDDLGLYGIENGMGLSIRVLPNGSLYSIEHRCQDGVIVINQLFGSPADAGASLYLRVEGEAPCPIQTAGPSAKARFGVSANSFVWEGETSAIRYRLTLSLQMRETAWLWRLEAENTGAVPRSLDAILIQDIGLADRGFLMNNEAYDLQYIDHHIARHGVYGPVILSRQKFLRRAAAGTPG